MTTGAHQRHGVATHALIVAGRRELTTGVKTPYPCRRMPQLFGAWHAGGHPSETPPALPRDDRSRFAIRPGRIKASVTTARRAPALPFYPSSGPAGNHARCPADTDCVLPAKAVRMSPRGPAPRRRPPPWTSWMIRSGPFPNRRRLLPEGPRCTSTTTRLPSAGDAIGWRLRTGAQVGNKARRRAVKR